MKIIKSEIDTADEQIDKVAEIKNYTNAVLSSILEFEEGSKNNNLTGEAWEKVLTTFVNKYKTVLERKNALDDAFVEGATSANSTMQSYCDGFAGGDSSLDNDGDVHSKYVKLRDDNLQAYNASLDTKEVNYDAYNNYLLYKKYVEYLEELPSHDSSAKNNLESARSLLSEFKSDANSTCL